MSYAESTNVISLANELPKSDTLGKVQEEYFDFSVTSNMKIEDSITYEIDIEPLSVDDGYNALTNEEIKVYLENTSTNTEVLDSTLISDLNTSTLNTNYKVLYTNTHNHTIDTETITTSYRLRAWIDYAVDATSWSETNKYQYKFRVNINTVEGSVSIEESSPEYCFNVSINEEIKTSSIISYNCYEGNSNGYETITDVVIPTTMSISNSYQIIENPSNSQINSCNQLLLSTYTQIGISVTQEHLGNICSGGNTSTTLGSMNIDQLIKQSIENYGYSNVSPVINNLNKIGILANTENNQYIVTSIGEYAFFDNDNYISYGINSVALSNTIQTIETFAFFYNNLETVVIPDSVITIENTAFSNNNIKNLELGNGVITIGINAFSNNDLQNVIIPDNVKIISASAFSDNNIKSLTIRNDVYIGWEAFEKNKIDNLTIVGGKVIPDDKCFLTQTINGTLTITGYNCYYGNEYGYETINSLVIPSSIGGQTVTAIGENAFYDVDNDIGKGLLSITFPDTITSVGTKAFMENSLIDLNLSNTMVSLESYSFYGNSLHKLFIPDSVTTINSRAFEYNNLSYIVIGENSSLISTIGIGQYAFSTVGLDESLTIYNNSGKAFPWINAVNGSDSSTTFVTGTVPSYTTGLFEYNEATITTGTPE